MALHTHDPAEPDDDLISIRPQFCQSGLAGEVPRLRLPEKGMPPRIAYQILHDELLLDGAARLNLATFVTTWMEPEAELLFAECAAKNMIDKDEYPQTAELERRCVNMIAHLWHAAEDGEATGCSTTGSSPASMHASLEPVVEQPVASPSSGACHRWAIMLTQRRSSSAVCGYSSLSIMFLAEHSANSSSASGSIHVVTNVARLRRTAPSRISSSCTTW